MTFDAGLMTLNLVLQWNQHIIRIKYIRRFRMVVRLIFKVVRLDVTLLAQWTSIHSLIGPDVM